MTMHLPDLRLAEALTEERLEAGRRAHISMHRRPYEPGARARQSRGSAGVAPHWPTLHRPAHGTAGH